MSLLVWLPMTKDLSNQGLENISITNNGATLDTNGKLGKCYSFGTGTSLILPNEPIKACTTECSLSMWLNITTWNTSYATYFQAGLGGAPWAHYIFGVLRNGTGSNLCFTISNGSTSSQASYTTPALTLNTWYHLTFVYKTGHCLIYINGELYQDYTTTIVPNFDAITKTTIGACNTTSSYQTNCKLNDVRIYDHALSPKEIEILSRGLVCHYPLNGGGRGGDNLLKNTGDLTLWAKEAGITTTWDSEKNMYKIEDSTHTNSRWGIYQDIYVEANTSYTITVTLDGTACGAGFAVYDSSTSFPPAVIGTTGRQSYTLTSGANSTKARVYLYTHCGINNVAWFSLPKVEKSDHTTPWIPNSADTAYTAMGYNSTTEYDVSGYGNNGTKQYITYETDTPRYSVSSVLSGSSTRIPNTIINIGNEWSYGLWFKSAAAVRSWEGLVILNNSGGDTDIQLGFYTNPNSSQIQTTANGQYNMISHTYDGKWHHLFATFDGTTLKTYKDGELVNTKTITNNLLSRSNLTIGARRRGEVTFDCPYKGSLSDFRLYATALSAAQVAELYNTAVSVANNGTLMGYELVEV